MVKKRLSFKVTLTGRRLRQKKGLFRVLRVDEYA